RCPLRSAQAVPAALRSGGARCAPREERVRPRGAGALTCRRTGTCAPAIVGYSKPADGLARLLTPPRERTLSSHSAALRSTGSAIATKPGEAHHGTHLIRIRNPGSV